MLIKKKKKIIVLVKTKKIHTYSAVEENQKTETKYNRPGDCTSETKNYMCERVRVYTDTEE